MELQCDICFNPFDLDHHRPKSLPCGHTICQECLQNPGLGGKCPTCRKDLNADPADLPDTIVVIRLIENDGAPPLKEPRTEETEVQQLRADGQLDKVDVAACSDQPGVYVGPPIISVLETTEKDFKDGRLKINDILQDRQRWMYTRSLKMSHGAGSEGLLRVVGPQLEELQIEEPVQPSVMAEVEKMKSLKRLDVICVNNLDYPDLPLQLQELTLLSPSENQLRCLERMPRLRSLWVYGGLPLSPNMSFAFSQHGDLRWLRVGFGRNDKIAMMSLIRAYAPSTQELQIFCSVGEDYKNKSFYFPDLGDELVACGLHALRRLVLVRPPDDPCTEQLAGCLLQCRTIGNLLPPHVQVVCQMCHKSAF